MILVLVSEMSGDSAESHCKIRLGGQNDWDLMHVRTRNQVRRSESKLLDLCEIVLRISVQGHTADLDQRVSGVRPSL